MKQKEFLFSEILFSLDTNDQLNGKLKAINETILNEYSLFDDKNRYRLCDNETDKWW